MPGTATLRISAVCDSSTDRPRPRLHGQAQSITPRDSSYYPTSISGSFINTLNFTIANYSDLDYVTRNAGGQITGGGQTSPDAFVPAGTTGTWSDIISVFPQVVSSVDWVIAAREQS